MTKGRLLQMLLQVLAGTAVLLAGDGYGHDMAAADSPPGNYEWLPGRAEFMPRDSMKPALRPKGLSPTLQYVFELPKRWALGQDIHVCFFGGHDAIRKRILEIASLWLEGDVNLRIVSGSPVGRTCSKNDKSEIRIGFKEPGFWSYVGNESLHPKVLAKPSMNLQGFDKNPPNEPRFTGTILHEFGHALGFHHEHQNPAGGCDDEYDWKELYAFYKKKYGWKKDEVDLNVRQLLEDRSAFDWSKVDRASVMLYASDPRFLKKGAKSKCYFLENHKLSDLDKEGARTIYHRMSVAQSLRSRISGLEDALGYQMQRDIRDTLARQLELTKTQLQRTPQ